MKRRRIFWKIFGIAAFIAFITSLIGVAVLANMARELPNPEQFINRQISQSTKIYDRTGQVLLYEIHGEEKRTVIPFEEMPDWVKKTTITIEDQGFYEHPAFDWRATIRALIVNLIKGRIAQGGSTITQQLAKNAFLTPEKTLERKIKELILAYWIEKKYSKDQILYLYLNQVPYGSNAYGIESASQTFLNKSAKNLTLAEAAALAALLKAPSYYSPWGSHTNELESRWKYILDQMSKLGFIDEEEKTRALNEKIVFTAPSVGSIKAPHFVMMVKDYLVNRYGEDMVENGGLKVITSLDWNLQQAAEKAVKEGAERNAKTYNGENAALVAQDPKTGQVLALVGSKDYFGKPVPENCVPGKTCKFEGNFDVASQGLRQPGSAFKPFAYVAAFKRGYSPDTIVFDVPTEFMPNDPNCPAVVDFNKPENPDEKCYHPENYGKEYRGPISFRNALAGSVNVPSVKVLYLAGLPDTLKISQDFGITTLNDTSRFGLSLVLGGGEIKLTELVNAYAVFSQEGVKHEQVLILEIKDNKDKVVEKYTDRATQVIEPQPARLINDILSDIEARTGLFRGGVGSTVFQDREVALKTGTTNDFRDVWAIGYTPNFIVGVWAGNNDNSPMGGQTSSILTAIPIWRAFLDEALKNIPIETFNQPAGVLIEKPMLDGNFVVNFQVHNILYYINKDDPMGSIPEFPQNDPQYNNWETSVQLWAQQNPLKILNAASSN